MEYTIEYVKNNRIAFTFDNEKEIEEATNFFDLKNKLHFWKDIAYRFFSYERIGKYKPYVGKCGNQDSFFYESDGFEIIKWSDFKAGMEYKLPEKWFIVRTPENAEDLNHWENKRFNNTKAFLSEPDNFFSDKEYQGIDTNTTGYTEITTEIFRKYVLTQENMEDNTNKKLIGYKLIKSQYRDAVQKINVNLTCPHNDLFLYKGFAKSILNLEKAGVLPLWFEPIYGPNEEVFILRSSSGNFELHVSKDGIAYKPESYLFNDDAIKELEAYLKPKKIGAYTISSTKVNWGCKTDVLVTDITAVLKAYSELKEKQ